MMAVTGACLVLSTLPGVSAGSRRALASGVRTNTRRAGQVLALVGPIFTMSYSARSWSSDTGVGSQPFWVRAWRNSRSMARSSILSPTKSLLSSALGALDGLPDALAGGRHVELTDADGRQRVHHRVDHGRERAHRAGFTGALGADRIQLGRDRPTLDVHVRHRVGARHGVVHERSGQELARLRVVHDLLHQGLAQPLGHAAVDLTLERDRIDHGAH